MALDGDECVRVPIIAERVHASSLLSLASLALPQPSLCHWVPMIAELCTHRFESLVVVLGVVATEPEPLRVDLRVCRLNEMSVSGTQGSDRS